MATIAVVPRAVVRDLYSGDKAAHILSLMGIVLGIAPVVAPLIGSHVHVWLRLAGQFRARRARTARCCGSSSADRCRRRCASPMRARRGPRVIVANYRRLLRSRVFTGYMVVAAFGFSGLFAFLAGSAFVFVSVMGQSEQGFGLLFGAVMLGNITGSTIGSRFVRRAGHRPDGPRRDAADAGRRRLTLGALALRGHAHPLAVVVPMFVVHGRRS